MCGIAGILGAVSPYNREALKRMSDALMHRGPDAAGLWEADPDGRGWGVMLAHRRLAILDLSPAGAQPMEDEETGDVVVYNGEVYNFIELRAALAARRHFLHSSGDTAVLLRALSLDGPEATASFRGMFAFAFWNIRKRLLTLARDALGMKPLYVYQNPDPHGDWSLAFASELRAVLSSGLIKHPQLNSHAVASIVWNGFPVAPDTAVQGVESLWPGEYRTYSADGTERMRKAHWCLEPYGTAAGIDEEAVAQELEDCVRLHLASDVPLGVFLSGGIDSSACANLAQRASGQAVHTFTLAFEEQERNEGVYARRIAEAIGTQHQEMVLTQNYFLAHLDKALDSLDQPTFDGLNSYFMSQAVRDAGFKVALVGTGGDELFGGYTSFRDLPVLYRWGRRTRGIPTGLKTRAADIFLRVLQKSSADFPPQTRWAKLPDMVGHMDDLIALYQLAYALFLPSFQSELLACDTSANGNNGLPGAFQVRLLEEIKGRTVLEAISILEQRLFLGERLLRDTDAVSMAASIEVRLPLVDQKLFTLVNRLPEAVRFFPLRKKALLRRIGLKGLSADLFNRPKSGFELPFAAWMQSALRKTIDQTLRDRQTVAKAGLNPDAVSRLWEAYTRGTPGLYWSRIWSLFVLVRWSSRHAVTL